MKVCFVSSSISRFTGGLLTSLIPLVHNLKKTNGLQPEVLSLFENHSDIEIQAWKTIPLHLLPITGLKTFGFAYDMLSTMNILAPDLVHLHGLWTYPSIAVNRWAKRSKKPYVITPHGMLDKWALRNSAWKKKIAGFIYENKNLNSAACIHSLSATETMSIRQYGIKNPICQIPNGVDLPDTTSACVLPPWHSLIPKGKKILLYLGRIHPKKGLANMLLAWSHVRKKQTVLSNNWTLIVAGWDQGGHESELKRLAKELELFNDVLFIGPQFGKMKISCYRNANAFILPSFSEGFPMVVLEAWSHGLPVIMTTQCNISEGFEACAAIQIQPDVTDISRGMIQLIEMSANECALMGTRASTLVKERFAWKRIANEMKSVYEWILGGGTPPDSVKYHSKSILK